jgi:hypothetical protein
MPIPSPSLKGTDLFSQDQIETVRLLFLNSYDMNVQGGFRITELHYTAWLASQFLDSSLHHVFLLLNASS